MLATKTLQIFTASFLFFAGQANYLALAEKKTMPDPSKNTEQKDKNKDWKDTRLLEDAVRLYETRLQNGSSSALNQVASAFYTLGEVLEKQTKGHRTDEERSKITGYYKKASTYFCKAAAAGCEEAVYNAGLALSKIKQYDEAASFYRQCINDNKDKKSELSLKSAVNLAVLILKKHVTSSEEELQLLMQIGEQNTGKRAETLLQTTMIILTDMNTDPEEDAVNNKAEKKKASNQGQTQVKIQAPTQDQPQQELLSFARN